MMVREPGLEVCGEADSAEAALTMARSARPDLAIVDLSLAQGSGLDLIRSLAGLDPGPAVLILSMHDETLFAERALRAGARGYIMKSEAVTGLVRAAREVLRGRVYVSDSMGQRFLERYGQEAPTGEDPMERLTDRELEVIDLIGRGLGTSAIADRLGLSVKTIETYRSNIKTKLALRDAADLIRFAVARTEGVRSS
jgi:DNA-binding NarL/FixJ family response regulator